jgi:hypothetical protein
MPTLHRSIRIFGLVFFLSTLGATAAVALLDYLIDPYAIFGVRTVDGINAIKPRPDAMLTDIKAIVGTRFHPSALILGNSRAEVGFDPLHRAFATRSLRAFNAAVPGSDMDYTLASFRRLMPTNEVAVVGVDFLDFLYSPPEAGSSSPVFRDSIATRALALFSTTALLDSLRTLAIQRERHPASLRSDGFNPLLDYRDLVANDGYAMLFRQRAFESARSLARQPHELYAGGAGTSPALSDLRALLQAAAANRTQMHLVIYPYHLLYLLQLDDAGLWPLFEQWKRDLTESAASARSQGARVTVWDFGCAHRLTAEPIPDEGDRKTEMRWYWEAGHFKKELGDLVLDRAFGEALPAEANDFGIDLVPDTVETRIAECRVSLAAMRQRFPALAHEASRLAKSPLGATASSP